MCKSYQNIYFIGLKKKLVLDLFERCDSIEDIQKRNQVIKNHYGDNYSASILDLGLFERCDSIEDIQRVIKS